MYICCELSLTQSVAIVIITTWRCKHIFPYNLYVIWRRLSNVSLSLKSKVKAPRCSREAQRRGRGIAVHCLDLGTIEAGGWSAPRPGRFTPGKDPVSIVQNVGWAPGPVWTCAKSLAPTGIQSPNCPARSQSLYRLSYPGLLLKSTHFDQFGFLSGGKGVGGKLKNLNWLYNTASLNFSNYVFFLLIYLYSLSTDLISIACWWTASYCFHTWQEFISHNQYYDRRIFNKHLFIHSSRPVNVRQLVWKYKMQQNTTHSCWPT
jgi:hypothetical protein